MSLTDYNPFKNKNEKRPDLEVYAMYDAKTEQYNLPSYFMNEHEARRSMERFLKDPQNAQQLPATNPEDFSLFKIGYYEKSTGKLTSLDVPVCVVRLHELKAFLLTQPSQ